MSGIRGCEEPAAEITDGVRTMAQLADHLLHPFDRPLTTEKLFDGGGELIE